MENIQQPTSNNQHPMGAPAPFIGCSMLAVGCWMLDVPQFIRSDSLQPFLEKL
jgi:hypothetical protein